MNKNTLDEIEQVLDARLDYWEKSQHDDSVKLAANHIIADLRATFRKDYSIE